MNRYSLHFGKFGAYFLDEALEEPMYLADVLEELNNPMQWNHIRTAPDDGTWILLAGPSGSLETPLRVMTCSFVEGTWYTIDGSIFEDTGSPPTKWAYLPND